VLTVGVCEDVPLLDGVIVLLLVIEEVMVWDEVLVGLKVFVFDGV
jgi:hypothetical protein